MTGPTRRKRRDEIKIAIAPFRTPEDYKACTDIQREVWRFEDIDIVPAPLLLVTGAHGGINLGAYNNLGEMVGFVSSFLGLEGDELIQHSHMLAVRSAYRNFDAGYKLKLAQRKEALRRKIRLINWTFDPMQPLIAYFNFGKLGAWSNVYEENYYGESSSVLHRGLPTDRFYARWDLDSTQVESRVEHGPGTHDLRKDLRKYSVINTLIDLAPGMAGSSPLKLNLTTPEFLFEVPYNLPDIKNRNLGVALEWQGKMRQVFRTYFKKGYATTDFWVAEEEGHLRAFYFLEKRKKGK
jgi:predicted GNAT superfamily acetyltransferase